MLGENAAVGYEVRPQPDLELVWRLRREVEGLLHIADVRTDKQGEAVIFVGQLARDADSAYDHWRERFRHLGYTPMLRREGTADILTAQRGLTGTARFNPLLNILLFAVTFLTTLLAGAAIAGEPVFQILRAAWNTGNWPALNPMLLRGLPFASALLFILGMHEMGHYVAARLHRVEVTLPYFIPVPFGLGTFGAFIQMRSPVQNRKALFDVGIAGPLAGLLAAVPLMMAGLAQSHLVPAENAPQLGVSLLMRWLVELVLPERGSQLVQLGPVAIAAWFGLLVTGFNLLPVGQLDGGHVAYAVLGKAARPLALLTFAGLLIMGYAVWNGWYTWAFFALITGIRHPEPLNDITPLDWPRRILGLATLALFVVLLTPRPF